MAKSNKGRNALIIGIIVSVVITAILLLWYFGFFDKSSPAPPAPGAPPPSGGTINYSGGVDPAKVLHLFDDDTTTVRQFQKTINLKLPATAAKIGEDGIYGNQTDTALKLISNNLLSSVNNNASINNVNALAAQTTNPAPSGSGTSGSTGTTASYSQGDDLIAKVNIVNVYDSANFSTAGLIKSVELGHTVGTFLANADANVLQVNTYKGFWSGYTNGYVWKSDVYKSV